MVVTELFAKLGLDVDETGISRGVAALAGLKTGLFAVGAAAAGLGVALAGMVKATVDYGSKINDLAASTGASTEALQKLGHVASLSGVSMEQLGAAMNFAVRKRGVKNLEQDLHLVSNRIEALSKQGKKSEAVALAMEKFGRAGGALVPFLREGSVKIAQMAQEFEDLGLVLSTDTVSAADELGDRIDVANDSFKGLAYTIATPLLKPLTEVVNLFIAWMKTHRKLIAAKVHAALKLVARAFKTLWQLAQPVVALFEYLTENVWILKAALGTLAVVLAAQLGSAIQNTVTALGSLLVRTAAVSVAPIAAGLAWLAFAALIALVSEDLYRFFTDGESLTARWSETMSRFLKELTAPMPEDPDWLKFLKAGVRIIGDLQGTWMYLKGEMSDSNFFENVLGFKKGSGKIDTDRKQGEGIWAGIMSGFGVKPSFGGGAVSPDASFGRSVNAAPTSLAPNINQTLNVTQPAGMGATEFAKMVADESNKNLEKIFAEAAAGVQ